MKVTKTALLVLSALVMSHSVTGQVDSIKREKRLKPLLITAGASYVLSMAALNQLWYSGHERESFHFFNDNAEWKQVDKIGHVYSAFQISSAGYYALQWAGLPKDKSLLYGSLSSLLCLTSIEVLDGFSSAYGASYGDMIANLSGSLLFYGQQKIWQEIRVHPKFSFRSTHYPSYRPKVLGENLMEQALKDYNGQVYWLSWDISKFSSTSKFPKWLNIAIGYGAQGMVYAREAANLENGFSANRQYFLSLDLDLNELRTGSTFVNFLLHAINLIHIPAPTLEFSEGGFKFHYLY